MKLTTRENTALLARLSTLTARITDLTNVINPAGVPADHVECSSQIAAMQAAWAGVSNALPTDTATGTGSSSSTVAGASAFRTSVNAGYNET